MTENFKIDQLPGRTIDLDGQECLFFSGTSYLGIAQNAHFRALLIEGMGQYGTVFGSSRNGNFQLRIYEEAEAKLAEFARAEAALTVSSGMLAGQAVVNWLKAQDFGFIYGPNAHPAIWQEPTLTLPQQSFDAWARQLPGLVSAATTQHIVIAVNAVDALFSIDYSFDWVHQLPDNQEITLLVDDSHGLGVIGPGGSGIRDRIPVRPNVRLIITASLAKAMGMPGGVIFANSETLNAIRRTAFFGACSPMPPAYLYAYCRATEIYRSAFERLLANIRRFENRVGHSDLFQHIPDYPVFYTVQDRLYSSLLANRIFVYSFAYPSPTDKPNTRIVINALHQPEDIEQLGDQLYGKT
ncbi:aminotransferase class I/II-fold pyridoxal phosphate-dependent enzyme [Larkinella rosea]|uniref:Aminotransferase class I/II-fold pyridoxal phosphate-dependent enzyme n=1 Tax=Larkinella rosea TaxID=2025312 RepID=A0A3P1BJ80_9BACT|nr:aminotransferase class I/II-fold pyridoxal phosphate-dependent enzyme [Larkinella rosea]RRB01180.1 aminotransferase class I/II-fold pyridoxal phosphate-dependent enzyme [Larkinella rosea]